MPPILKLALILGIIFFAIYGLLFLLIPAQLVAFVGSAPFHAGWIRWSGGILLAVAFGLYRVLTAPSHQGPLVLMAAVGTLLIGLAIIFSWVMGETDAVLWFVVFSIIANLVETVLLYLGWQAGQSILS